MGKVITLIGIFLILCFVTPIIVLTGWNCARELWPTLPEANYWQVFWISNAISIMFKSSYTFGAD